MVNKANVLLEYKADSDMTYVYGENLTEEAKAEIIEILDLTNEHDEDREWALFLSVFIAVDQVEREIDSLLKTQEEKSDVESPKIC